MAIFILKRKIGCAYKPDTDKPLPNTLDGK